MTVYITKYALTAGIQQKEAEISTVSESMIVFLACKGRDQYQQPVHKPFWHLTQEEAAAHADKLRRQKLASLQKQMNKLQGLKF